MKIYLASGFTIMNVDGMEELMLNKFGRWNRLISFYDSIIGNNIFQILNLKKKLVDIKKENK